MLKDSNLEGLLGSIKTVEGELCLEEPYQQEGMFGRCNLILALSVTPSSLPVFHEGAASSYMMPFLPQAQEATEPSPGLNPLKPRAKETILPLRFLFVCFFVFWQVFGHSH